MGRSATALNRDASGQSGVAATSVVMVELPFQIALVPIQSLIEVFAPDGSDQSLDEGMRMGCVGDGLDLINLRIPRFACQR
jgi:hypothetical protein